MRQSREQEVFLSLGSNMGSRLGYLDEAVTRLSELAGHSLQVSPVYETTPVGYLDQSDFLNMAVGFTTNLSPRVLLRRLLDIEAELGRTRDIRFGPRTLDLDILLYGNEYVCFQDLQIPHPRMWERAFVLCPLAALIPERRAPGGWTIHELARAVSQEGEVRYVGRFW